MPPFCVARLSMPARLRASHGVLQAEALAVASEGARAAALMVQEARLEADALLAAAAMQAGAAVRSEQARIVQEASALLDGLRSAQAHLLDGVGPLAVDIAARAFARLVLEMAPDERIASAVRRICDEAPQRLLEAVAWVHPDDAPALAASEWEVRHDARLARGTCKLTAASGEWVANFDLAAAALQAALAEQPALMKVEPCTGEPGLLPQHSLE